jgi:peroxidase
MDGACNNLLQPLLGAAFTPFTRLLLPTYDDSRDAPFSQFSNQCITHKPHTGAQRPSPRRVTRFILSAFDEKQTDNSAMMMQWGQFVSHDLARTRQVNDQDCQRCNFQSPLCANLPIEQDDTR